MRKRHAPSREWSVGVRDGTSARYVSTVAISLSESAASHFHGGQMAGDVHVWSAATVCRGKSVNGSSSYRSLRQI
jgi:hypothetical protein